MEFAFPVVTDNMKTAVLGRDEDHQPIWNPAYQKLAVEFKFHPDVCAPASGKRDQSRLRIWSNL